MLNQKIDSFELIIVEKKLKIIVKFRFSRTLRQLEIYLSLIDWLRNYIVHYVDIFKSLQNRKIELLRHDFVDENQRRVYFTKTFLTNSTKTKLIVYNRLQTILVKSSYLIHVDIKRQLFIDLNINKKFDMKIMLYYVKEVFFKNLSSENFSLKHVIESILFFNRFITLTKFKYWLTKLEIARIVWILRKIRHIVEISSRKIIIYIDYESALEIVTQIILIITFIDKLNLRLIRISNYIQRFNLEIRHKSDKQHIIFDALSRLISDNHESKTESELNVLFTIFLVQMKKIFRKRLIDDYKTDFNWHKIFELLDKNGENAAKLSFCKKNDFIFRFDDIIIDDHVYEFRRLCISQLIVQNILQQIHDKIDYVEYIKCFEKIIFSYFIRDFSRYLRFYFKHCSNCLIY